MSVGPTQRKQGVKNLVRIDREQPDLLPRHHLRDGHSPSEYESSTMRRKVLLGIFRLGELLDVHGEVLRQNGMCPGQAS